MPAEFTACQASGGKIRTVTLAGGKYMRVCLKPKSKKGPQGGRTVAGEVRKKKIRG